MLDQQTADDLVACERLAAHLGIQELHVSEVRRRLHGDPSSRELTDELRRTLTSLRAAADERDRLLTQWATVPGRLVVLGEARARAEAREATTSGRSKVPPVVLPDLESVAPGASVASLADVAAMPFTSARALMSPVLQRLERAEALMREADRRLAEHAPDDTAPSAWHIDIEVDPAWYALKGMLADRPCPPAATVSVPLVHHSSLVGRAMQRGAEPDVTLDDDTGVSRRHAQFVLDGERLTIVDLSSTNGTYVVAAGSVVDESVPALVAGVPRELDAGDRVYLGAWSRLTVRASTPRRSRPADIR